MIIIWWLQSLYESQHEYVFSISKTNHKVDMKQCSKYCWQVSNKNFSIVSPWPPDIFHSLHLLLLSYHMSNRGCMNCRFLSLHKMNRVVDCRTRYDWVYSHHRYLLWLSVDVQRGNLKSLRVKRSVLNWRQGWG